MRFDRRRASHERRQSDRVPAVFAVKKAIAGHDGTPSREIQLCQAEDIAPAGITIKRPRGSAVLARTEVALSFVGFPSEPKRGNRSGDATSIRRGVCARLSRRFTGPRGTLKTFITYPGRVLRVEG